MSDKIEDLLRETARRPDESDLQGFAARVRAAGEVRRARRWLGLRDLGFALAGAAAALAFAATRPAPIEAEPAPIAQATFEEELPATALPALEALDGLDDEDLAAFETLLDERLTPEDQT
jgi:hypothetical protein